MMPLGVKVGLGPGDIVLDGDPAPSKRGTAPPAFQPISIVTKQLDGYGSSFHWYGGRSRPRPQLPPATPPPENGHSSPPLFGRCLLWPNGHPSQLLLSSCFTIAELLNKLYRLITPAVYLFGERSTICNKRRPITRHGRR